MGGRINSVATRGARRPWVARLRAMAVASLILTTGLVAGSSGAAPASAAPNQRFTTVTPTRLLDTRTGVGAPAAAVGTGGTVDLQVTGRAGIPASGVSAVVLNVTAVTPTRATYVTVYPTGSTRPTASNLNLAAGATRANLVLAAVGTGGKVTLYNYAGTTHLVADVTGWYGTASSYHGQAPQRILDTRTGVGAPAGKVSAGRDLLLQVTGAGGVPATGVAAVVVNLTGTGAGGALSVTAYPSGGTAPTASNLNLVPGLTAAVLAVVGVGPDGKVGLHVSARSTDLVADVQGWFGTGGEYTAVTPTRVLDTRTLNSPLCAGCATGVTLTGVAGVPAGAEAAVLSVTAVGPTRSTYLTVWPYNLPQPKTSNLNLAAGAVVPNLVVVDARYGYAAIANAAGATHVVVDLLGYISAPGTAATTSCGGTVGTSFTCTPTASGGVAPTTWSVTAGTLPPGVTLTPATGLSGVPTTAGVYTFTLELTDALGQAADTQVTARIGIDNRSVDFPTGEVGRPYSSGTADLVGATAPFTWTLTGGTLPAGLSLDAATGVISGTPTTAGTTTLTLDVVDANGGTGFWTGLLRLYPHVPHGVFGWGDGGRQGALGNGYELTRGPVQATGLRDVVQLAPSSSGAFALTSDGTVWGWGSNASGQLGTAVTGTNPYGPVQIAGLSGITAIGAASSTGYAVKSDGTVWAWGSGAGGLLGTGTSIAGGPAPVQVPGITGAVAVAGNTRDAYVVKSDGTVWGWGEALAGALGTAATGSAPSGPVQIAGLSGITAVRANGQSGGVALASDGTVWTWGVGGAGQLGNGTNPAVSATPVQVSGLHDITQVAAGSSTAYALSATGTVWAWGNGTSGQLGNGQTSGTSLPSQVTGLTSVVSLAAGPLTGYAVTADGQVWGWGWGPNFQLGNGTRVSSKTPVRASHVPAATAVAAFPFAGAAFAIGTP